MWCLFQLQTFYNCSASYDVSKYQGSHRFLKVFEFFQVFQRLEKPTMSLKDLESVVHIVCTLYIVIAMKCWIVQVPLRYHNVCFTYLFLFVICVSASLIQLHRFLKILL